MKSSEKPITEQPINAIPIRPMTELENAQVRISVLMTQTRHYSQEIAVLQAEKKELDRECSDLSAQNSYQAQMIEEQDAAWQRLAVEWRERAEKAEAQRDALDSALRERDKQVIALLGAARRPDPLGEALNSGDGSYRP